MVKKCFKPDDLFLAKHLATLTDQAELADRTFYLLCHSAELRVPLWTAHQLAPSQTSGDAVRPRNFRHDHSLLGPIARNADYRNSGWHRGHMVPAEDLAWSPESIRATILRILRATQKTFQTEL